MLSFFRRVYYNKKGSSDVKKGGYRMDLNIELLAEKAIEAKEHAYVPYSHFRGRCGASYCRW